MLAAVLGANAQHRIDRMDRALSHRRSSATEKRCVAYGALFANSVAQVGSWVFGVSGSPRLRNTPLDADRLATLWNEPDESWLREVVGPFALTRFSKDSLDVVRDVAGIYPVYWCRVGHGAAVSLEPKGLLALPELSRRLNRQALVRYMAYSFVPGDETMLDGVFELPPAHRLSLRDGACTIHAYDDLRPARAERSLDEDAASVRRLTEHSIDEQLRGRSTVFLSGGLDSSIIAAELAARSPGTCHAYSIHFGPRYPNELEFAREVARRSRLQHHEVELSPKRFIPKLRRAIWHLDDPIGDPITVPNFLLAERVARDGFDTVFNGEGGDPLFGGPKNLTMMLQHWYGGVARGPEFRERAYLRSYRRAYELIGPLLTPDLTRGFDVDEVLETPLRPFLRDTKEPAFLNRLMRINMTLKGANLILPKVDRMLGAHGLRIASPLFDARLLRASLAMNPRHKLARGIEKVVLKHAWSNVLPLRVLERPKSGMRVPVHYWFKREARRYIRALLSRKSVRAAGWFNVEAVEKLLRYELSGQGRFGIRLWMLLTLELWRRLVLEREPI